MAAVPRWWRSSVEWVQLLNPPRRHRARLGDPGRPARPGRGCTSSVPLQGATMCRASDIRRFVEVRRCVQIRRGSQPHSQIRGDSPNFVGIRGNSWRLCNFVGIRGRGRGFVGNDRRGDALKPRGFANLNTRGAGNGFAMRRVSRFATPWRLPWRVLTKFVNVAMVGVFGCGRLCHKLSQNNGLSAEDAVPRMRCAKTARFANLNGRGDVPILSNEKGVVVVFSRCFFSFPEQRPTKKEQQPQGCHSELFAEKRFQFSEKHF